MIFPAIARLKIFFFNAIFSFKMGSGESTQTDVPLSPKPTSENVPETMLPPYMPETLPSHSQQTSIAEGVAENQPQTSQIELNLADLSMETSGSVSEIPRSASFGLDRDILVEIIQEFVNRGVSEEDNSLDNENWLKFAVSRSLPSFFSSLFQFFKKDKEYDDFFRSLAAKKEAVLLAFLLPTFYHLPIVKQGESAPPYLRCIEPKIRGSSYFWPETGKGINIFP